MELRVRCPEGIVRFHAFHFTQQTVPLALAVVASRLGPQRFERQDFEAETSEIGATLRRIGGGIVGFLVGLNPLPEFSGTTRKTMNFIVLLLAGEWRVGERFARTRARNTGFGT